MMRSLRAAQTLASSSLLLSARTLHGAASPAATDAAAVKAAGAAQGGLKPVVAAAAAAASGGFGEGRGRDGKSEQAGAGKSVRGGPVLWLSFLLLLVTGGGIIVYYDKEKKRHIEELKNKTNSVKPGQSVGTAAIGGPFTLLNHDGKPVTEKDFLGKWTLLHFGFTHCPDICPDELQKMAAAINKIRWNVMRCIDWLLFLTKKTST